MFRLRPFGGPRARSLTKMPKAYLWDWSLVADRAARFENLVASHLLKLCHFLEDRKGHAVGLHYLRDRDGHEVDFLVTAGRRPWFAVEVKLKETRVDPALVHFRDRLTIPGPTRSLSKVGATSWRTAFAFCRRRGSWPDWFSAWGSGVLRAGATRTGR